MRPPVKVDANWPALCAPSFASLSESRMLRAVPWRRNPPSRVRTLLDNGLDRGMLRSRAKHAGAVPQGVSARLP
jgi:hypothetical protein